MGVKQPEVKFDNPDEFDPQQFFREAMGDNKKPFEPVEDRPPSPPWNFETDLKPKLYGMKDSILLSIKNWKKKSSTIEP